MRLMVSQTQQSAKLAYKAQTSIIKPNTKPQNQLYKLSFLCSAFTMVTDKTHTPIFLFQPRTYHIISNVATCICQKHNNNK